MSTKPKFKCVRCNAEKPLIDFLQGMQSIRYASCRECRDNTSYPRQNIRRKYNIDTWDLPNGWWTCHIQRFWGQGPLQERETRNGNN